MQLTPSERDRLLLFTVAELARGRRARGLRLNVPEATAVIADAVVEAARDGRTHEEAVQIGRHLLGADDVLPGVASLLPDVKVEAGFEDGTRLVVIPWPIGDELADQAAPGRIIPAADLAADPHADHAAGSLGAERDAITVIDVENTSRVAITVTSHYHFFEANPRLRFDRSAAYGRHLDIAAGASVTFPPGAAVTVRLTPIRGQRAVVGSAGLVDGPLDAPGAKDRALALLRSTGFLDATASPTDAAEDAVRRLTAHVARTPGVRA